MEISEFDPGQASEADLVGYYRVVAAGQAVDWPAELRLTYENVVGRLNNPFPGIGPVVHRVVRVNGVIEGVATVYFPEAENSHLALVDITVHPERRRQGIGTAVLRTLLPELRTRGRRVVEALQVTKGGDGERWVGAMGFRTVHESIMQLLLVADVDRALWDVPAPAGYRLRQWVGTAPDDIVDSYARARDAIHDAPTGQLDFQEPQWTAERVRESEAELREREIESRVVVAVHEVTGEVAGLTELHVPAHRPHSGNQRDTSVRAAHRGHGLGRCVKARMLRWLLADRPALERVVTGTGAVNTHMARVNHEVGFTTVLAMIAVQADVEDLTKVMGDR